MRITIAAVGQRQPAWADAAVKDYLGRLPADWKVEVKQVKAETRSTNASGARLLIAEGLRLRAAVPAGATLVALDERGKDCTTLQLTGHLQNWRNEAQHVAFAIGGADGLDPSVKADARIVLRLSSLTLPHALARVILAEQLYRAWTVLAGHPYHRG
ncbi:MAG: 23S rRNA (pseudouridine(1915)-N(3))-methyltransferase RlmH [Burkholderiaceae bacterium]